jgi:hypothetical protein
MTFTAEQQALINLTLDLYLKGTPDRPDGICQRPGCGLGYLEGRGTPKHYGRDGYLSVGCRAASFTVEDGWNDDLPRKGGVIRQKD